MTFDLQPSLQDSLIEIRPLIASDFEELYAVASDALIWEQHQNKDRYVRENFTAFFNESIASKGALTLRDLDSQKIIGSSRFKCIDEEEGIVEIGWSFLSRDYWGGSYNKAFKRLMINYALQSQAAVVFYVNNLNYRSQRAMEKLGARRGMNTNIPWVLPKKKGVTFIIDAPLS